VVGPAQLSACQWEQLADILDSRPPSPMGLNNRGVGLHP